MADQAVRNGYLGSSDRQSTGVIEGVSSLEVIWLHSPYSRCAWPPVIYERVPKLRFPFSQDSPFPRLSRWPAQWWACPESHSGWQRYCNVQAGIVMMVVALVGLVIVGVAISPLARSLTQDASLISVLAGGAGT